MRPSLGAVKVFTVVASVRSFTQAAQLLHVTQGAVSQQIAKLEDTLGITLFNREARQLTLTQYGRRLYRGVNESMLRIEAELDSVRTHRSEEVLSISTFGSFAAQWLMPRIGGFEARHPSVRLHVETTLRLVDFHAEGVDLGLRFGSGEWPGLRADHIFRHRIYPVCSPEFAAKSGISDDPGLLAKLPLFYDLETPTEWSRWFAKVGLPGQSMQLTRGFSDTLVMLSALRNGLDGVALVGDHLTEREINSGALVRLFEDYIEPEGAYYLVYPQQLPLSSGAVAFREWVLGPN